MANSNATPPPASALPFEFGGSTTPVGCRRIFITAEMEPSNGDPRIQPTGFPDVGPVLYPDPAEENGAICLIESEASMANWLESVCLIDKHIGILKPEFHGLPYIRLTENGQPDGPFKTSSTIDGHRFASEYIMGAKGRVNGNGSECDIESYQVPNNQNIEMVEFVRRRLGMPAADTCPAASVPEIYRLAMEYDPLALLHGFQISLKNKLTFVGLRSARAITSIILGLGCERVTVPGVRFDPIGTGEAGQAIFQKQRIIAKKIEARFSIDVALLTSLRLDSPGASGAPGQRQAARAQLLLAIALWKVAAFLDLLRVELSLRTECKLRLKNGTKPRARLEGDSTPSEVEFPFSTIAAASLAGEDSLIVRAQLPPNRSPLTLLFA